MYRVITTEFGTVIRATDSSGLVWYIPQDEANTDYQDYLRWLAEGNTVEQVSE